MLSPKKQLNRLRKATAPRKQFKATLWSRLSAEWDGEYPAMRVSWTKAFAVPVAAVVVFVSMGMGTYAYASPEVTEGTALYPVKQGVETVEARLHRRPYARARFHARMLERRIAEGEVMYRRGNITRDQLVRIKNELDITREELQTAQQDEEAREELIEEITQHLKTQGVRYRHLLRNIPNR